MKFCSCSLCYLKTQPLKHDFFIFFVFKIKIDESLLVFELNCGAYMYLIPFLSSLKRYIQAITIHR